MDNKEKQPQNDLEAAGDELQTNTASDENITERPIGSTYRKLKKSVAMASMAIALAAGIIFIVNSITRVPKRDRKSSPVKEIDPRLQSMRREAIPKLPFFSPSDLEGYASCSELESDILEAGKSIIETSIQENIGKGVVSGQIIMMYNVAPSAPVAYASAESVDGSSENGAGEDSYGTNTQVEGVDEADIVKSDGKFMYVAYGDEINVLSLDGEILYRTKVSRPVSDIPEVDFWNPKQDDSIYPMPYSMPYYWAPSLKVTGLLLNDDRLVAIVSSYHHSSKYPKLIGGDLTTAFTYSINQSTGLLSLVDTKNLRGTYQNSRSINNAAYVVSNTYIDSYKLHWGLNRYNHQYWNLSDQEYEVEARALAAQILPQFSKQLMVELFGDQDAYIDENACRHIVRLSLMYTPDGTGNVANDVASRSALGGFAQVASFDMKSNLFYMSQGISGAFLPTSDVDLYASEEMLVMAGQGYGKTKLDDWTEYTYLMGFDLQNGIAMPSTVGVIPGYLLNQFSMDYHKDHLRVATTRRAQWGYNEATNTYGEIVPSSNQVMVLKKNDNMFEITGKVEDLGISERIYAVRFLGDRGFVVTFRTIDPLYSLDLSDPSNPFAAGELKIPGFSNYLHPVEENYLLAVGQDADEKTGGLLGLQISLFDVSDLTKPIQLQKTVVDKDSNSESQNDHHAFRYLPMSKALILPVSVYGKGNIFDGFHIYDINKDAGITKLGEVVHADNNFVYHHNCFSNAYLDARSLVFDSNLITFKGHTVIRSGYVKSPKEEWKINLDEKFSPVSDSCYQWFPWV